MKSSKVRKFKKKTTQKTSLRGAALIPEAARRRMNVSAGPASKHFISGEHISASIDVYRDRVWQSTLSLLFMPQSG